MTYETQLDSLYAEREAAMAAWDATAYNEADGKIRAVFAAMRAEVSLGLRDDPIYTREA